MSVHPLPSLLSEEQILRGLLDWCNSKAHQEEPGADTLFRRINPVWIRRFALREALLPWVREQTGLATFYSDELDASSTPRTVAKHLARRMLSGCELPTRPPVIPFRKDKVKDPTVFVLTCPRSGSTLLRCMLMGHPSVYAPPELHLAEFDSMRERERRIIESGQHWKTMGLAQTVGHLTGWNKWEAFHYTSHLTKRDIPVAEVYRLIHALCPKPIVVDKSPSLTLDAINMLEIERKFEQPKYIFLTRHPSAVIESIMSKQIDPPFPKYSFDPAEGRWRTANDNVLRFLGTISAERWHRLTFEDLMEDTEGTLRKVTDFLGILYHSPMADAYEGNRLQGGIGCINLPQRKKVEKELGERWKHVRLSHKLSKETEALALRLGYVL